MSETMTHESESMDCGGWPFNGLSDSTETDGCAIPVGLKPKYIHDQQRKDEICRAVIRYFYAGKKIPTEWIEELRVLVGK